MPIPSRAGTTVSYKPPLSCHCEERSDVAISCRNYRQHTNLFVCTICRFADGTPSRRALRSADEATF